jgi:predicted transcriptional regulator of viral defense system
MKGSPKPRLGEAWQVGQPGVDLLTQPPSEAAIVALAERQHALITLPQLQLHGLGKAAVAKRAKDGRLYRVHRGVYAVGRPSLTQRGRWMAAVLAYGPTAVLSHRSAAALHGLRPDNRAKADVTLPSSSVKPRPRIDVHRSRTLTAADVTTVDGIPCTTVARTLVDLGDDVDQQGVQRAVSQAEVMDLFDGVAVDEALALAGPRRGARILRAVLADYEEPTLTRTELEKRFLALCRRASVSSPAVNAWITLPDGVAYQVDFLWREERIIVETDSRAFHSHRTAFENDRLRDQRLTLAGYTVLRFTWRQVTGEAARVAATITRLLARGRHPPLARLARP